MSPQLSLIIPTLNEAENLPPLLEQINSALVGRSYEVLIVDDNSRDNTKEVAAALAEKYPLTLITRTQPKDGLSGAVLTGMAAAKGETLVVMDADLQHPPARLPALIDSLGNDGTDFSLGSRHVAGGSVGKKWGTFRKINSWVATQLSRPFAGRVLDPMSGFFALRRSTFESGERLTPLGYKIGLELMCKCKVQHVTEVPIHFAERTRGESKLTLREQFRYLEHLSRLYDFCFPRLAPVVKFLIVTTLSWLAGLGVYLAAVQTDAGPALSPVLAYFAAIFVVAVFHNRYIRTQREFLLTTRPWAEFLVIAMFELITCALVAIWMTHRVHNPTAWELFLFSFGAATLVRYILRKEFMHDIRGLRREMRKEELA